MTGKRKAPAENDRLIFLSEALQLVPFSETTLRRAITRGDLEAWQPSRDGKLVMWRSVLVAWATRRPAGAGEAAQQVRQSAAARVRAGKTRSSHRTPEPISFTDLR